MTLFREYLKSSEVQKVLHTRPGQKGFSLVELVVVIAVLAILSAVAIPNFITVQSKAQISAVKNGIVNGIKECVVAYLDDPGTTPLFVNVQAFTGEYTGYGVAAAAGQTDCFGAVATSTNGALPTFTIEYDELTGGVTKTCAAGKKAGKGTPLTCTAVKGGYIW